MKPAPALTLILASLVCSAEPAIAAGVNLSWDACTPEGGVQNKTFACNSNTGSRTIYGSFVLAADQTNFVGIEATVDFHAESDSLPAWWQFLNLTACRKAAMSISFDFGSEPASSCTDPWSGQATGAVAGYRTFWTTPQVPSGNPNEARALVIAAVSSTIPQQLAAGSEYYCFKLTVSSAKTVGTGACDGCSTPMCITLSEINAVQSDGNHEELTQPETANVVTWHSASGCPGANAAQNVTWGQIRSLLK